jgi:hypothetical protein
MIRGFALAAAAVLIAGCELQPIPELALKCQTVACTCLPAKAAFPVPLEDPPEVQWRANGDAYCPEGYVLREAEEK